MKFPEGELLLGDCLDHMKDMEPASVDLVFGSPPYEDARTYGIGFNLKGQDWVDWMVEIFEASLRISKGLVAFVVGHGKGTRQWSGVPALLCADLIRKGVCLRSPLWYKRNGIMGSGGSDWMRADLEWIICGANEKVKLPWSDNVACGHPPKYGPGGNPSHRNRSGKRVNELKKNSTAPKLNRPLNPGESYHKKRSSKGEYIPVYTPPLRSNPGNVIDCGTVGGGKMGSNISYEGEAAFPEKLANFMIRSFCPRGGIVYDPFGGSGTTLAVAIKTRRKFICSDIRESQIELMKRRIKQARTRRGFREPIQ